MKLYRLVWPKNKTFKVFALIAVWCTILIVWASLSILNDQVVELTIIASNASKNETNRTNRGARRFHSFDGQSTSSTSNETLSTAYQLWSQRPSDVNWNTTIKMCASIVRRKPTKSALSRARRWKIPYVHTDRSMADLLVNCSQFRDSIPFARGPSSSREEDESAEFQLAYAMVGARNAAQFVRLFRMLYQPQNAYCITYDDKATPDFKETIRRLTQCFADDGNVFLAPDVEVIKWGSYAILRSVMRCMRVLANIADQIPWRYVQVVSWNDFPLRTNDEMTQIFRVFNGSQDCELERIETGFIVRPQKRVPPDGLTVYKGSFASSMTREFVDFMLTNPTSQHLYDWYNDTHCAEEQYWQTLIHNLRLPAPGQFPGECIHTYLHANTRKPYISRYQVWQIKGEWYPAGGKDLCKGKMVAASCVYGVGDLSHLITNPALMAHKMYEEFEPAAMFCMEHWFWNRAKSRSQQLDLNYYEQLPSVRYHKLEDKNSFVC